MATDIVALVGETVPLRKGGASYKGLCPFHREKTPSFNVNPEKQIFKCFGCGAGGDIFSFVMKTEGVSFNEAAIILAERAHIEIPTDNIGEASGGEKARLYEINQWAADLFHRWLLGHECGKTALTYLEKRGVSEETIKRFRLGYSPDSWDALATAGKKKGFKPDELARTGLLSSSQRADRLYDRFRNRLMFPITDTRGKIIAFGARALDNSEPKYLNSPETRLFSKGHVLYGLAEAREVMREKRQAVVVEGYMDVIMAHQYGVQWTVGVLGTALSRDHVRLLRRYVDEAVLVFDPDDAGQTSANRSLDAFSVEELSALVATLPDGLDPDDFLRQRGTDAFLECLAGATDGITHKMNRIMAQFDSAGTSGAIPMAKALDDVLATIALIPNPVARSIETEKVSQRAGVPEAAIRQRVDRLASGDRQRFERVAESQPERSDRMSSRESEEELLEVLLHYPETLPCVQEHLNLDLVSNPVIRALIERLIAGSNTDEPPGPVELLARTQDEAERQTVERIIGRSGAQCRDPLGWCRELIRCLEVREHAQTVERLATRVSKGMAGDREAENLALAQKLAALREAHRKRGGLSINEGVPPS